MPFDLRSLDRAALEAHIRRSLHLREVFERVFDTEFLANNDQVRARIVCIGARVAYHRFLESFRRSLLEALNSEDPAQQEIARSLLAVQQ